MQSYLLRAGAAVLGALAARLEPLGHTREAEALLRDVVHVLERTVAAVSASERVVNGCSELGKGVAARGREEPARAWPAIRSTRRTTTSSPHRDLGTGGGALGVGSGLHHGEERVQIQGDVRLVGATPMPFNSWPSCCAPARLGVPAFDPGTPGWAPRECTVSRKHV